MEPRGWVVQVDLCKWACMHAFIHSFVRSLCIHGTCTEWTAWTHSSNPAAPYSVQQSHQADYFAYIAFARGGHLMAAGRTTTDQAPRRRVARGGGGVHGSSIRAVPSFKRRPKTHPPATTSAAPPLNRCVIGTLRPPSPLLSLSLSRSAARARLLHLYQTSLVTSPPLATNDLASPSTPAIGHVDHPEVHIPIFIIALFCAASAAACMTPAFSFSSRLHPTGRAAPPK